jgi:hypothetical protein
MAGYRPSSERRDDVFMGDGAFVWVLFKEFVENDMDLGGGEWQDPDPPAAPVLLPSPLPSTWNVEGWRGSTHAVRLGLPGGALTPSLGKRPHEPAPAAAPLVPVPSLRKALVSQIIL